MKRVMPFVAGGLLAVSTAYALAETAPSDVEVKDMEVAQPVAEPGDAARGRLVFMDRKKGNCLACHANSDMPEQPFHGEIGPPLDGAGERWTEGQLRAIVINSKAVFGEQTIMPGFYRTAGLNRVADNFQGTTILSAQEVEDVVAYLLTLKE